MSRRSVLRALRQIGIYLAVVLAMIGADAAGLSKLLDDRLAELRFATHPRMPTGDVVLVDIDARSLAETGVWPWPRRLYADLLDQAAQAGAARVAFDIDFSARSSAGDDAAFAAALSGSGIETFLAAFMQHDTATGERTRVSMPFETLLQSSWPASVNVPADADGRVRRLPESLDAGNEIIASMPSLLAGREPAEGRAGIDYAISARRLPRVSFVDALRGRLPTGALAGKTLIVGASAIELHDLFPVPAHGTVSGSTVLALATETLLQDREMRSVALPWLFVAGCGALVLLITRRMRMGLALLALSILAFGSEALALLLQQRYTTILATADIHVLLACLAVLALFGELDLRRLLLWIARANVDNGQNVLERVIDDGFDGIVIVDDAMRIARANPKAHALFGFTAQGVALAFADLPRRIAEDVRASMDAFGTGSPAPSTLHQTELTVRGEALTLEYAVAPFRMTIVDDLNADLRRVAIYACLTLRDVTERERSNERIRFMALHDGLTGLGNRNALERQLDELRLRPSADVGTALLSFDLDRFKSVNDALGHGIGDLVLGETARRARAAFGDAACLARVGGDEYAALLSPVDLETAREMAAGFVDATSQPYLVGGHRVSIGTSVGIAWWTGTAVSATSAMRRSDVALYRAKRSTNNKVVVFEASMDEDRLARLELERDLLDAFDRGEFELFYQPQVRLSTGAATGAEALLRWRHPGKGLISPVQFIPVAEEMGLIHRLGAWALVTACREAAGWRLPITLAVNVSALQFETGDLVSAVRDALSVSQLAPERLELEITESAFVGESGRLKGIFDELLAMGVTFSLDDFGTGYSSLGYLHRFPVSKIKIDRSFVTGIPVNGHSMAVLRSVMALADGLGIRTIAEGIETTEEAETLRILGCRDGQGYLFSKPVASEGMRLWLSHQSAGHDDGLLSQRA